PARTAFDTTVANHLCSWLSPGGLAGEPAAVYVMHLRGMPVDAAVAIMFAKFATSFAVIYGTSAVLLFSGYGPAIPSGTILPIAIASLIGVVVCGTLVAGAIWPSGVGRALARFEAWLLRRWLMRGPVARRAVTAAIGVTRRSIERLALFRTAGLRAWLAILA